MNECFCVRCLRVILVSWMLMCGKVSGLNSLSSFNAHDSTKKKYSAMDVLNPDCPCYKYQKKAEREYQHLLRKEGRMKNYPEQAQSGKPEQVKKNRVSRSTSFFSFNRKSSYKTTSFNFSRRREKKGLFNFFKKNIAACTF